MLILGAAMLLAPDAPDEARTAADDAPSRDVVAAERPDVQVMSVAAPAGTQGVTSDVRDGTAAQVEVASRAATGPADLDGAVARAAGSLLETEVAGPGSELQVRPLTLSQPEQPSLETLVTQARAEGNAPSLSDPASLGGVAISAETQGLIARIEASEPDREAAQPAARSREILYVTGTRVNLRAGPSTGNPVVGSVVYGDAVELLDFANESWAQIRIDDEIAYMSRRFLSPDPNDG